MLIRAVVMVPYGLVIVVRAYLLVVLSDMSNSPSCVKRAFYHVMLFIVNTHRIA